MKRQFGLLILIFFTLITSVFMQDERGDALSYNRKGIEALKEGRVAAAAALFETAVKEDPNFSTAYLNLGTVYFQLKQFEKAEKALAKASKSDFLAAAAFNQLGAVYLEAGKLEKAIDAFKTSLRSNPANAVALYNLGCAFIRAKNYEQASIALRKSLAIDGTSIEASFNLGFSLIQMRKFEESAVYLESVVNTQPNDPLAHFLLGTAYRQTSRRELALREYAVLKNSDPSLAESLYKSIYGRQIVDISDLTKAFRP